MSNNDKLVKLAKILKLAPAEVAKLKQEHQARSRQRDQQRDLDEVLGQAVASGFFDDLLLGDEPTADDADSEFAPDEIDQAAQMQKEHGDGDELAFKAKLREHFQAALQDKAPFVRINPLSVLKGTLGGQQEVASGDGLFFGTPSVDSATGATMRSPIPRLAQVAFFEGSDEETLPVSVIFAMAQQRLIPVPDGSVSSAAARSYGIVKFGTRGFQIEVEVDIGRGQQFTIPASTVQLLVGLDDIPPGGGGGPISIKLSGMLSFYPIVRTTPVTRTRYIDGLAGGASTTTSVPPLAKSVIFWRTLQAEPFTLNFLTVTNAVAYSQTFAANAVMTVPIDLSPDIVSVQVSDTGVTGLNGRLIFQLSL